MTDSILNSIKAMLGIVDEDTSFDVEAIIHINAALMSLNLLGVGPSAGFEIEDNTATWSQFVVNPIVKLSAMKTYVFMRVKLIFDPPTSAIRVTSMENEITRQGWALSVLVEEVIT